MSIVEKIRITTRRLISGDGTLRSTNAVLDVERLSPYSSTETLL